MKEKLGKQILAVLLTCTLCLTSVEWSGIAGMIHSVHAKQTTNETSETKKIVEKNYEFYHISDDRRKEKYHLLWAGCPL